MDEKQHLMKTASDLFKKLRLLDEARRSESYEAESTCTDDTDLVTPKCSRRTYSTSVLPVETETPSSHSRDSKTLHSRVKSAGFGDGSKASHDIFSLKQYLSSASSSGSYGSSSDDDEEHPLVSWKSRFGSFWSPPGKAGKRRSIITRDRFHMLPILKSGKAFSPLKNRDYVNVRPTGIVLLLTVLAFMWTISSLLLNPVPLLGKIPNEIVNVHLNNIAIEERIKLMMREDSGIKPNGDIVNIQLPFSADPSPSVSSFADLTRAKDICPYASSIAQNATVFERQFGAKEFHSANLPSESKKKVALFTGAYSHIRDGVSLTLNKMVAFLEENNHEMLIFAPTSDNPALEAVGKILSVPSMPIPGRADYRLSLVLNGYLQKQLSKFDPDVVHIATPDLLGFQAMAWAKWKGKPIACSYHTRFNSYLEYYNFGFIEPASWFFWLGSFYSHCDHIYVPSKEIWQELRDHGLKNEIKLWARGVDSELFTPAMRCPSWRQALGIREEDVVVLLVCRMVWEKNLNLYAKAIKKLEKDGYNFRPVIVGDGPVRAELQKLLPHATFVGTLKGEDLSTAYASADIFLFPSVTETFGSTTLEAMASGLPVVVANSSGSNSLVTHGVNGYIADPNNADEFASYTADLIVDRGLRMKLGNEGVRIAHDSFTYEKIFGELVKHYQNLTETEEEFKHKHRGHSSFKR